LRAAEEPLGSPERVITLGHAYRAASWHGVAGRPVHIVGWSPGGVVAREVARAHPDRVAQAISYGTPVVGGPVYPVMGRHYAPETVDHILRIVEEANRTPSTHAGLGLDPDVWLAVASRLVEPGPRGDAAAVGTA
jgi:pimeloyl-ACP methyl ester carboxylesterase